MIVYLPSQGIPEMLMTLKPISTIQEMQGV